MHTRPLANCSVSAAVSLSSPCHLAPAGGWEDAVCASIVRPIPRPPSFRRRSPPWRPPTALMRERSSSLSSSL